VDREELVESIALEIKQHYCNLRNIAQRIVGFMPGEKWSKYFIAAAENCIEHRISPHEFVEVQFAALKPWPQITALGTQNAVRRFKENRIATAVEVAKAVSIQFASYESLVNAGHDRENILIDIDQGFDPLFIYVIACRHGYEEIAEDYFEAAAKKYLTSAYFDGVYKTSIPQALVDLKEK